MGSTQQTQTAAFDLFIPVAYSFLFPAHKALTVPSINNNNLWTTAMAKQLMILRVQAFGLLSYKAAQRSLQGIFHTGPSGGLVLKTTLSAFDKAQQINHRIKSIYANQTSKYYTKHRAVIITRYIAYPSLHRSQFKLPIGPLCCCLYSAAALMTLS